MKELNKFFNDAEKLLEEVKKHKSKWIAYRLYKERVKKLFLLWNKKIKHILLTLPIPQSTIKKIDVELNNLYEESLKSAGRTFFVKNCLEELMKIYLTKVLPRIKANQKLVPPLELINLVSQVRDTYEKDWLEESIKCFSSGCFRSAIIMAWIAVMWNLYKKIERKGLKSFNKFIEEKLHLKSSKKVKKLEDLEYYSDKDVLLFCEYIGIIDRTQRSVLESCLQLRNKCAHPGKYKPGRKKVESFFEDIFNIVFLESQNR